MPAAARVLELGSADDELANAYRQRHPACAWHAELLSPLGMDDDAPLPHGGDFDLIVVHDCLQRVADPLRLLRRLGALAAPAAQLFADFRNDAQLTALQRLVEGDLSRADGAVPLRHAYSPPSFYKLLMDAGWMPHQAAAFAGSAPDERVAAAALLMAETLGVPRATARQRLSTGRVLVQAQRSFADIAPAVDRVARFAVVVPTTRDTQLELNVGVSPGLHEVDAPVFTYRNAASPAEALEQSLAHVDRDWVLLCHQDVYFPAGFGERLNAVLDAVPAAERDSTLIGFAGMAVNETADGYAKAGFVIDRAHRFDHSASLRGLSIDELAIVVSRRSVHRIDPAMGWHLWATDLCLAAICRHKVFPRIVRLPLFHNSLNDYQLPQAFHHSARVLAAKYPAFGPIHTLCGVIGAAPAAPTTAEGADAEPVSGNLSCRLPAVEAAIDSALEEGDCPRAVQTMMAGVHQHYRLPEVSHKALYYPELDRRIVRLASRLAAVEPLEAASKRPHGELLVATELYPLGGHSRVLEDVSHEMNAPTLVLTDLFKTYRNRPDQLEWVKTRFAHATVVVLGEGGYWQKCAMLRNFAAALNPRSILHFAHHQDPIPYIATLDSKAPNKVFMHHGDHNPSLGCTIEQFKHIDLSEGVREQCASQLSQRPDWLPLYVQDQGVKTFGDTPGRDCSVVGSGHPAKFSRSGPLALGSVVRAALTAVGGRYYHVGPLDAAWIAEIRASLKAHAIDPERFVAVGLVESLWRCLLTLDAAFYIGSAPLGGGRAAIEAQGCGYPVLYFENSQHALPANHPLYASRELAWTSPEQLTALLRAVAGRRSALGSAARAHYEQRYSRTPFRQALDRILAL